MWPQTRHRSLCRLGRAVSFFHRRHTQHTPDFCCCCYYFVTPSSVRPNSFLYFESIQRIFFYFHYCYYYYSTGRVSDFFLCGLLLLLLNVVIIFSGKPSISKHSLRVRITFHQVHTTLDILCCPMENSLFIFLLQYCTSIKSNDEVHFLKKPSIFYVGGKKGKIICQLFDFLTISLVSIIGLTKS